MVTDPDAPHPPALPDHQPPALRDLALRARGYAEAASSANTRRAYAADWKHFAAWCRREGLDALTPDPQVVGLYITACASGAPSVGGRKNAVSTIERRLSALVWAYTQRGLSLDRRDRHIATVLAGIRNSHAAPPRQKEAILPEADRPALFSGHSLRACLASSAEVDERQVQKQLGHASAEMTRR